MPHRYQLPFIVLDDEGYPSSFWNPALSGDYAEDCRTGADYAAQFLAQTHPCKELLFQRIIEDLAKVSAAPGGMGGVEIGFLFAIGSALPHRMESA